MSKFNDINYSIGGRPRIFIIADWRAWVWVIIIGGFESTWKVDIYIREKAYIIGSISTIRRVLHQVGLKSKVK